MLSAITAISDYQPDSDLLTFSALDGEDFLQDLVALRARWTTELNESVKSLFGKDFEIVYKFFGAGGMRVKIFNYY